MNQPDVTSSHAAATLIRPRTDAFIEGAFTPAAAGERFESVNPATGEVLGQVASCAEVDVDRAVGAARRAFDDRRWAGQHPRDRKVVLLRLAELIRDNADELALLDSLDAGKLISDTTTIDVPGSAAILQWYAEAIDKTYGEIAPTPRVISPWSPANRSGWSAPSCRGTTHWRPRSGRLRRPWPPEIPSCSSPPRSLPCRRCASRNWRPRPGFRTAC